MNVDAAFFERQYFLCDKRFRKARIAFENEAD